MSKELLKKSLQQSPIVKKGDYQYVIHPITDGIPEIPPALLREVTHEMKQKILQVGHLDKIVTMEAMGIPLATALSLEMNLPFTIIRKRHYGLPDEISVEQMTGYSKSKLYINGINKGDNIVIVDDVLSTGGTLRAVLSIFKKINITVKGVFIAVYKGNCLDEIQRDFSITITPILTIDVVNGKVKFLNK
jgi:adenine phosphoribosyltransferase